MLITKRIIMTQKADERFIPGDFKIPFDPFLRHYERYFQCLKLLGQLGNDESWLDCACGSGYGTNFLSNFSNDVTGYDIDDSAIQFAKDNYKNAHVDFINNLINCEKKFDVIFSIETIEHMPEIEACTFLRTLHEAMKDFGTFIITTPIVKQTNFNPINEFHFIEYSNDHFVKLLEDADFIVLESLFVETKFTDGETKDQGYYKCKKK